ncbi:MAG: hypothetical protein ABI758_04510 [Candidatus Woesebacteria bacterium]
MSRQLVIGVASVFVLGVVMSLVFSKKPTMVVAPTATPNSTATISSENCLPSELKSIVELDGAAGSINANFTIQNISDRKCILSGENQIQLHYDSKINSIKVTLDQPTMQKEYPLEPTQMVTASARIPNGPQCSGKIAPVAVLYTYVMSDGLKLTFADPSGEENFSISACADETDITEVRTTSLSSQ